LKIDYSGIPKAGKSANPFELNNSMHGHSYDEIQKRVNVSYEYVDIVRWMTKKTIAAKE